MPIFRGFSWKLGAVISNVWQTVKRINIEIVRVKGLIYLLLGFVTAVDSARTLHLFSLFFYTLPLWELAKKNSQTTEEIIEVTTNVVHRKSHLFLYFGTPYLFSPVHILSFLY